MKPRPNRPGHPRAALLRRLLLPGLLSAVLLSACESQDAPLEPSPSATPEARVESCYPTPSEFGDPGEVRDRNVAGVQLSVAAAVAPADEALVAAGLEAAVNFVTREFGAVERPVCVELRIDNARAGTAVTIRNRILVFTTDGGWNRPYSWLLTRAAAHEYVHVWAIETANDFSAADSPSYGPGWLTEGIPEYLSMRIILENGLAHEGEAAGFSATLLRLSSARLQDLQWLPLPSPEDYAVAELAVSRLVDAAGIAAIDRYYAALAQGIDWEQAFEEAFLTAPDRFVADFDSSLPMRQR